MKIKEIPIHIKDVDCNITIEVMSKAKDIFDYLEQYVDNLQYDWFDPDDESFQILYKDGTSEYIDNSYDGHKIKRIGIQSMVYNNPETYIVYGTYEINDYGVVNVG